MKNKIIDANTGELAIEQIGVITDVRTAIERVRPGIQDILDAVKLGSTARIAQAVFAAQGADENAQAAKAVALWADREAGAFLKKSPKNEGGRPPENPPNIRQVSTTPTLSELDIDKHDAERWQLLAEIPEEQFVDYIDDKVAHGWELTAGGLVQIAKQERKKVARADKLEAASVAPVWVGRFETGCIYQADVTQDEFIGQLPEASVDLVITDPPWDEGSLQTYAAAARIGERVLKPGHFMAIYSGKMFLPQILSVLTSSLEYVWTFCVFQPDSNDKIQKYHLYSAWRPVVLLRKAGPSTEMVWMPDALKSVRDKRFHEWGQGVELVEKLVEGYSQPGEIVLDPFVGGGSVPSVAREKKRQYIGFDVDGETVRLALGRLKE